MEAAKPLALCYRNDLTFDFGRRTPESDAYAVVFLC
jgi:hypothetical protein